MHYSMELQLCPGALQGYGRWEGPKRFMSKTTQKPHYQLSTGALSFIVKDDKGTEHKIIDNAIGQNKKI